MQKILLIFLIVFVKIGSEEVENQNKAFLCFILCICSHYLQKIYQPFALIPLNDFNYKTNSLLIMTIFLGLFSSICQNETLEIFLMIFIILLNMFFLLNFFKNFFLIKAVIHENSKIVMFMTKSKIGKYFKKGSSFCLY